MSILPVIEKIAFAVYAADAAILTGLVHENILTNVQSLDIASIIAALAAGFHGGVAIKGQATGTPMTTIKGTPNVQPTESQELPAFRGSTTLHSSDG